MANTSQDTTEPYPDEKADVKTGKKGKAVVRRIDLRLVPIMALLYLCSHIDRGNIGNAKIEGMDKDLGLPGNQYNIASTIFFIPYIIFGKKLRPSIWLSVLVISWGIVMTLMGVVQNFQGMVACRVFLGLCEDGFFRGAVTVALGLGMPFLLVDTPEQAAWLTDGEKRFVDLRLRLSVVRTASHAAAQEQEGVDRLSWRLLGRTMVDWKIGCGIVLAWANSVPNAAFKFTMPFHGVPGAAADHPTLLLRRPRGLAGGGRYSDRLAWRFPFIVGPLSVLMAALAVLFAFSPDVQDNVSVMYFAVVLAQIGIYPLLPGISVWVGNNLAPSSKRSIGLAWLLAVGNLGSLVGTNIFLDREGPRYPTGYGIPLGIICLAMCVAGVLEFSLWKLNKAKAAQAGAEIRSIYTQEQLDAMGEKSPLYQYTL
ncbi:High-affinity nicotinic acid transporter [Apiospora phragmitis]|uniref:High-affinity nicotinic acid transporter n=1 Tax=Apiospora phragmitis TaxID=2905665 RepID=A0ABR1UZT8_9PEZI